MIHTIIMPDLGQTTAEGEVLRWFKAPGEKIAQGEHLLEVETDKVSMEVESYRSGYLRAILIPSGERASALTPIAIVTDSVDEPYESTAPKQSAPVSKTGPVSPLPQRVSPAPVGMAVAPAARALAKERGINLQSITGTGPGGLITRRDVEQFAAQRTTPRSSPAMAALVTQSKQSIPDFYLTADVEVFAAEQWRSEWNAHHPELSATLNDVFVRAASRALRDVPGMNVAYAEGKYEQKATADVLLVAAAEAGLTLVSVPDPGALPWEECLRVLREALERGRSARLREAQSHRGPRLAISNLGMYRVKQFTAIIPPSCTAVLAIGAVRQEPVVADGKIEVGQRASLTLSADHRVIDGITAAKFMEKIQEHLNNL